MIVETKFSKGDVVYVADTTSESIQRTCPDCLGTRSWHAVLPSGEELDFTCPTCHFGYESRGTVPEQETTGVVHVLTIGSVRVETNRKPDERIIYMCEETGIGSGKLWYESKMFGTRAEAEAVLPQMVHEQEVRWAESAARQFKTRKNDRPTRMAAHYRAQIRSAKKDIERAEEGLERETRREPA